MARRIEHRSTSEWPATRLYEALVDPDHLRERLRHLGGTSTELLDHATTPEGVTLRMRQSVAVDRLPPVARSVVGGDLLIDRTETWREAEPGHSVGEVAAEIAGVPCAIAGSMWLRDLDPPISGLVSEFVVEGTVRVHIPLVGGKLEDLVVDQVRKLLVAEERFTADWLSRDLT